MGDDDPLLSVAQAAELAGFSPATWRGYVSRGLAPEPDDPDEGRPANRRSPRWRRSAVELWKATRVLGKRGPKSAPKEQ